MLKAVITTGAQFGQRSLIRIITIMFAASAELLNTPEDTQLKTTATVHGAVGHVLIAVHTRLRDKVAPRREAAYAGLQLLHGGHSYASTYLYTSPYHPHNNYFECTRCGYLLFAGTNEIKLHGNGTNNTCQQCPILDVSLLALKEYDNGTIVERNSYFNSVKSDLSNIGLDYQYENFFTLLSPISTLQTNMITRMQASELFFIHSHGTQNSIVIGIDNGNYYSLSSSDLCNVDLSELRLAVLLTCKGAAGDGTNYPENILEQMLCSGSETVLGFSSIARVGDCNLFAKRLVLRMTYNNESISDAVINMPYIGFLPQSQDIPFILDAVVIGGNDSLSL